jgi:hypothetical protein
MRWHNITQPTPQARVLANAVFNQVFASGVVPQDAKKMTYIDVHTESSGASDDDEGPVYRLFPNGAVDVGFPEPQATQDTTPVEYFVTMNVEQQVGFSRVESRWFEDTMEIVPGDTMESLHWRAWSALAKQYNFDGNTGKVVSWSAAPNRLPLEG